MADRYSSEDIERWDHFVSEDIKWFVEQIESGNSSPAVARGRGLLSLSSSLLAMGMVAVARQMYAQALGYFRAACRAKIRLCEKLLAGEDIDPEVIDAGDFQTLLVAAFACGQDEMRELAESLDLISERPPREQGPPDSIVMLKAIRLLVERDRRGALQVLERATISVDPRFKGYMECLVSIARQDQEGFTVKLCEASAFWEKYVHRAEKGLVYSVSFIHGLGLLRLAEFNHLTIPDVPAGESIPVELLGATEAKEVQIAALSK